MQTIFSLLALKQTIFSANCSWRTIFYENGNPPPIKNNGLSLMCWLFRCTIYQIERSAGILASKSKFQSDLYGVSFLFKHLDDILYCLFSRKPNLLTRFMHSFRALQLHPSLLTLTRKQFDHRLKNKSPPPFPLLLRDSFRFQCRFSQPR